MKNAKHTSGPLLTVKHFEGTSQELARSKYQLAFMQTGSRPYACKASGLSPHAHQRIINMLSERGHTFEHERSGRPQVYTDIQMEAAYEALTQQEEAPLTGVALLKKLIADGEIHTTATAKRFLEHLRAYIQSQGQRLITNSSKTTFFISIKDVADRQRYAHTMQAELQSRPLESIVFADEVIVEESAHPKGEGWGLRQLCN
jgi:hypothetical protein